MVLDQLVINRRLFHLKITKIPPLLLPLKNDEAFRFCHLNFPHIFCVSFKYFKDINIVLALNKLGDHKVVDFWSKGHIIHFQIFVEDTPFLRCLS